MRDYQCDVAVIGSGLIGLSVGVHLLLEGKRVAVVSPALSGEASDAAAGMLTPACEYDPWMPREFYELQAASLAYYPVFLRRLGVGESSVDYRASAFTLLDLVERSDSILDRAGWMRDLGIKATVLSARDVCVAEPGLSPRAFHGAIRIEDEAVVNPRALRAALRSAFETLGGQCVDGAVVAVSRRDGRVVAETDTSAATTSEQIVLACGSWLPLVAGQLGLDTPMCPVKGQMLALAGPPQAFRSVVFMPGGGCGSIVERKPGVYVVGTSEEYLSATSENTVGSIGRILSRVAFVAPATESWQITDMWSGFRPMTPDEMPILGQTSDPAVFIAAGHHRNGVLLTPITGKLVADLMMGRQPEFEIEAFRYGRPMRPYARFATKY